MERFPDTLLITRSGTGSTGSDDVYTPGTASEIYSDGADVQDVGSRVRRDLQGTPLADADAVAFLEDEDKLDDIQVGDHAEVTFSDASVRYGEVIGSRKLDGQIVLKWLGG